MGTARRMSCRRDKKGYQLKTGSLSAIVVLFVLALQVAHLLSQPLAGQRLLDAALFSGLEKKGVLFDFLDDIFLLHFALEAAESVFQTLIVVHFDKSH
jgi:hypothetical protein